MARIAYPDQAELPAETRHILAEVASGFGSVPKLYLLYGHCPALLKANWEKVKGVLLAGQLSRKTKEAIALLVSTDNICLYCVAAHRAMLRAVGIDAAEIARIEADVDQADFTPKERALIAFARHANTEPLRITDDECEALRAAGATDAETVETLGVMEIFTAYNRFLDALAAEL